jgi:8-oxo-dGTP pyrophosphatase MutT (NUDIX family)
MSDQRDKELNISRPGAGEHIISPSEAIKRDPDFFQNRPEWANWRLRVKHLDGRLEEMPPGTDWEAISRFGSFRSAVITDNEGKPAFDKPRVDEAPAVNVIAYGKDKTTGELRIAMISQPRPHADNDFEPDNKEDMVFEQIPMGYLEKIIGKDPVAKIESAEQGAIRETSEETGATAVIDVSTPEYSKHYPNPRFVGTSTDVVFVEVDLDKVEKLREDKNEPIYKADYIPLGELIDDIKRGKTERGYARIATSNSAILMFLSNLNSFRNAERNQRILSQEGQANKQFKQEDPAGYVKHSLRRSAIKHPENYEKNKKRIEAYLSKLYKDALITK